MKHRADIDGLRALAIIPVVLFHAGYDLFSGGFVGVDVFFVISGYLITKILLRDISADNFSVLSFYERRARRILPAYLFMITGVFVCGYYLLLSSEFKAMSESMLASLGFVSNFYFWQNSGYFSVQAESSPLLHTWSLSVEEQFYIFFPVGLLLLSKFMKINKVFPILVIIFSLSFLLSIYGMRFSISAVFYLLPTRAWELLAGALLATGCIPNMKNKKLNNYLSLFSLLMILLPVFTYTENTLFPGFSALLPVLGTALLIYSGESKHGSSAGRMLSLKPVVFVGGLSYSLYLWHWPVFVFMKTMYGENIPIYILNIAIILSLILSWFSLKFIEKPFLDKKIFKNKDTMLIASLLAIVIAGVICVVMIFNEGFPQRFKKDVLKAEASLSDYSAKRDTCHVKKLDSIPYDEKCIFGSDVEPSYVFWGDSHAVELSDVLGAYAASIGVSGKHISYSSCPPSQQFTWVSRPMCSLHNAKVLKGLLKDSHIKTVFLIARYNGYSRSSQMTHKMLSGFEETVSALSLAGKEVVVIYPIPRASGVAPIDVARLIKSGGELSDYNITVNDYAEQNVIILDFLNKLVARYNVDAIFPTDILCKDGVFCEFLIDGDLTHFDDDHLSLSGARLFIPELAKYLKPTKARVEIDYEKN